ncbi:MAG: ABC transporter permease [Firmicutes bacterium]|nr:ABC transporter permease [Bacillota bacterium]
MKNLIAFWQILKKDINNYYLKPPNISWGIIFPLSWALMQLLRSPGEVWIKELLPGLMAMSVLFGTTSMLAVTITFERRARAFDRLLIAPVRLSTLVAAKLSGAIVFGIFNAFLPLIFGTFFVSLEGINWALMLIAVFLLAALAALLGLLVAVSAREVFEAQTLSNFFRFPLLFLCGFFLPITQLPKVLRILSLGLPFTYGADLLKGALLGKFIFNPLFSLALMVISCVLLFLLCQRSIAKRWIL